MDMPNGTSPELSALWDHANENARNIARLQDSEAACQQLRLVPMQYDLRVLKEAVMAPRDGLVAKVDLLALHQQEAKEAAEAVRVAAEQVAAQLKFYREERIRREAATDERLRLANVEEKRAARMKWLIGIGITAMGVIAAIVRLWLAR
jgi:hypothetical protein